MASTLLSPDCSTSATTARHLIPLTRKLLCPTTRLVSFERCLSSPWTPSLCLSSSLSKYRTAVSAADPYSALGVSTLGAHFVSSASEIPLFSGFLTASMTTTDTTANIIDGKLISKQIKDEVAAEVVRLREATGVVPGLAVILVGSRKDSQTYVRNKKKACEAVGIKSFDANLPEDCTEDEVLRHIEEFNKNPEVHGILVQLPLPMHMNEERILTGVSIEKDVDGFHPLNIGRLAMQGRDPLFVPCTPKGCIELLHRYNIDIKEKRAVVIGRSNIVGMPAALLLQKANATVTMVHSKTMSPGEIIRQADIVISAAGVANLVRGSWLKPGAVVIDVGINPVDDANSPRGYRLVGDVCYEEASKVASYITPVPGGVGPMTIAMLLSNTLLSAKRIHNFK